MNLTTQQQAAIAQAADWFRHAWDQRFTLGGYAGTGKTTCIEHIVTEIGLRPHQVAYCTFTGKAATVLTQKGCPATTIHRLIYNPKEVYTPEGRKLVFQRKGLSPHIRLIVVDEAPMVSRKLLCDLHGYGLHILMVGDPGQLGPVEVESEGPKVEFISGYEALQQPSALLTQIHRQAEGHPIIRLSLDIREGRDYHGDYGSEVVINPPQAELAQWLTRVNQVICGRNATRADLNKSLRLAHGHFGDWPQVGEKIICTRNDWGESVESDVYLTNGLIGEVVALKKQGALCPLLTFRPEFCREAFRDLSMDTRNFDGKIRATQAGDRRQWFEFGYAITAHKSQGSQWDEVAVKDEPVGRTELEIRQWRYTATTRAAKRLVLF